MTSEVLARAIVGRLRARSVARRPAQRLRCSHGCAAGPDPGYQPGPLFGQILATVEDAQLEGQVRTKEDALALVRAEWPGAVPE